MSKNNIIIGIGAEIEDPNTGALAKFHAVSDYSVNQKNGTVTVNIGSYISKSHYDIGKQAISHQHIVFHGFIPRGQDALNCIYHEVVAPIEGKKDNYGNQVAPNLFTGAELLSE